MVVHAYNPSTWKTKTIRNWRLSLQPELPETFIKKLLNFTQEIWLQDRTKQAKSPNLLWKTLLRGPGFGTLVSCIKRPVCKGNVALLKGQGANKQ